MVERNIIIRERILALCRTKGKKWVEVYQEAGMGKTRGSLVLNGKELPPVWLRRRIAELLGTDSTIIWDEEILIQKEYALPDKEEGRGGEYEGNM